MNDKNKDLKINENIFVMTYQKINVFNILQGKIIMKAAFRSKLEGLKLTYFYF